LKLIDHIAANHLSLHQQERAKSSHQISKQAGIIRNLVEKMQSPKRQKKNVEKGTFGQAFFGISHVVL
jgi:hypothetical protein